MKTIITLLFTIITFVTLSSLIQAQGPKSDIMVDVYRTTKGAVINVYGKTGAKASLPTLVCEFPQKPLSTGLCQQLMATIGANERVKGVYIEDNQIAILTKDHILAKAEIAMVIDMITSAFHNNGVLRPDIPSYYPNGDGYHTARFKGLPTKVQSWMSWTNEPEKIHQPYVKVQSPGSNGMRIPTTAKDVNDMCKANPNNCIATRDRVIRDKP